MSIHARNRPYQAITNRPVFSRWPLVRGEGPPSDFGLFPGQCYLDLTSSILYIEDANGDREPFWNFASNSTIATRILATGANVPDPRDAVAGHYYLQLKTSGLALWGPAPQDGVWAEYGSATPIPLPSGLVLPLLDVNCEGSSAAPYPTFSFSFMRDVNADSQSAPFTTKFTSLTDVSAPYIHMGRTTWGEPIYGAQIDGPAQNDNSHSASSSTNTGSDLYTLWLAQGNTGSLEDFLTALTTHPSQAPSPVPFGGIIDQVLAKASNSDHVLTWKDPAQAPYKASVHSSAATTFADTNWHTLLALTPTTGTRNITVSFEVHAPSDGYFKWGLYVDGVAILGGDTYARVPIPHDFSPVTSMAQASLSGTEAVELRMAADLDKPLSVRRAIITVEEA